MKKRFKQSLKVRSYELDSQGHVNYAVYLSYLEYARVATMEQLGIPFQDFIARGIYIVIADIKVKYRYPAAMGDELEIFLEGLEAGRTSLRFKQEIFLKENGKQILEAELTAVFVDKNGKPIPIDKSFRRAFLDF